MCALLPTKITESAATLTVTSPPIHNACAPRETSESSASSTEFEFSTLASSSSMPLPRQTSRIFDKCPRISFRRIPGHTHSLKSWEHLTRDLERIFDGKKTA